MSFRFNTHYLLVLIPLACLGNAFAQTVPIAPPIPACAWDSGAGRSACKFKDAMTGTPTSVAGHSVILFRYSTSGGQGTSRTYLDEAVKRLATRYGFTARITEDPSIFQASNLADAKAVIMSNGDGDVLPAGANRSALEDFQQVNGWGVIWIHEACAFISSAWPFGRKSCVQQYLHHSPSGTERRVYLDSGTVASPNHGIRNPQTEFLLRDLPGWDGKRALSLADKWFCFQAPVRDSAGVSVLFGLDQSSGLTDLACPGGSDSSEAASLNHNLSWTHPMGQGITIYHSWGHDEDVYTGHGNMGDSLLWRYIRYAAKDWCVSGSGDPGCDGPLAVRASGPMQPARPETHYLQGSGGLSLSIPDAGLNSISLHDIEGHLVFSESLRGPGMVQVPALPRGLYLVRISGKSISRTERIMAY
jgi:hypothetical protein